MVPPSSAVPLLKVAPLPIEVTPFNVNVPDAPTSPLSTTVAPPDAETVAPEPTVSPLNVSRASFATLTTEPDTIVPA